jgi:hypothetical protein
MVRHLKVLLELLKATAIAYVITILLCIWQFTIGIKESIKNLYKM